MESTFHLDRKTFQPNTKIKIHVKCFMEFIGIKPGQTDAELEAVNQFRKKMIIIMELLRCFVNARKFLLLL